MGVLAQQAQPHRVQLPLRGLDPVQPADHLRPRQAGRVDLGEGGNIGRDGRLMVTMTVWEHLFDTPHSTGGL
jgi:hypothetical protein